MVHGIQVMGYTEYKRANVIFRAHPKYRNERPWYDYAMLAWEEDIATDTDVSDSEEMSFDDASSVSNDDAASAASPLQQSVELENNANTRTVDLVPAQLLCFVQYEDQPYQALVHSCYSGSTKVSVLTNRWRLEYKTDTQDGLEQEAMENYDADDSDYEDDIEPPQYREEDDARVSTPLLRFVSVDIIEKHCLMIPYHKKSRYLMQVIEFDKWASRFLDVDNM